VAYFSVVCVSLSSFSSDRIDLVQQICLDLDRSGCVIMNAFSHTIHGTTQHGARSAGISNYNLHSVSGQVVLIQLIGY